MLKGASGDRANHGNAPSSLVAPLQAALEETWHCTHISGLRASPSLPTGSHKVAQSISQRSSLSAQYQAGMWSMLPLGRLPSEMPP